MMNRPARMAKALWHAVLEFMSDDCPRMAAALSYYTIFSLPPLLALLMLSAGSLLDPVRLRDLLATEVGRLMGQGGAAQVIELIQDAGRPEIGGPSAVLGLIALLFAATGGFGQLQSALNRAWNVAPDPNRGDVRVFFVKRMISLAIIASLGFLLLASLVISTLLSYFGEGIRMIAPAWLTPVALQAVDATASLLIISSVFSVIFQYVPDARVEWRDAIVGAIFTGLLFTLGKAAIGYWLGRSDPGSVYGAAGSLAVTLLWIYYTAMILLLGAEFTEAIARERGFPPRPQRGAVRVARTIERATPIEGVVG